ncbi:MAG: Inorganic pyrophosphatase [Erysipelotrichaceae bacterium]|nr:Inorganic pyrophosphatase [Erysipelotrichaceae bacterium]
MELENNAYFWQKLDTLYLSGDLIIDRPKGTSHPSYSNLIYPVDYGHLKDIQNSEHIACYRGSEKASAIKAMVVCADILNKDIEVKLLVGCNEKEERDILGFLNQTDFQKSAIIRRGSAIPDWANSSN